MIARPDGAPRRRRCRALPLPGAGFAELACRRADSIWCSASPCCSTFSIRPRCAPRSQRMTAHLAPGRSHGAARGRAGRGASDRCDSTVFKARHRELYLDAVPRLRADAAARSPASIRHRFRTRLLPHLHDSCRDRCRSALLALATALSLPDRRAVRAARRRALLACGVCARASRNAGDLMALSAARCVAIGVFVLLGVVVGLGRWYESRSARRSRAAVAKARSVHVTNGGDRGPGTLREALFIAAAATGSRPRSRSRCPKISSRPPLPPLVNPHGISVVAQAAGRRRSTRMLLSWRARVRYLGPEHLDRGPAHHELSRPRRSCCARCAFVSSTSTMTPAMSGWRSPRTPATRCSRATTSSTDRLAVRFGRRATTPWSPTTSSRKTRTRGCGRCAATPRFAR